MREDELGSAMLWRMCVSLLLCFVALITLTRLIAHCKTCLKECRTHVEPDGCVPASSENKEVYLVWPQLPLGRLTPLQTRIPLTPFMYDQVYLSQAELVCNMSWEIEGKYQTGHIRTMPDTEACQLAKREPQL
ncbi:hypothetical protein NQZ68_001947 [Dissostichus eleginoides]|nr:hypothetical protein NQZ68_001947 [Dissostichus eleginoides]